MPSAPTSQFLLRPPGHQGDGLAGFEWMVDAYHCEIDALRSLDQMQRICNQVIADLKLKVLGNPLAHQFEHPGGVTAMYLLSESHLTVHTYPEYRLATFNLYCCRSRPQWDWQHHLRNLIGAQRVETRRFARGAREPSSPLSEPSESDQGSQEPLL